MHKQEFIFRGIQEALGNECTEEQAEMVFEFALANDLVDSNCYGDWDWTDKAREEFGNRDDYGDPDSEEYIYESIDLCKLYHSAEQDALKQQA